MTCYAHPWGASAGLDCVRTDVHLTGHVYAAAWAADRHTDESSDE